jgi:phage/plasmid-like protein (TIGR03299 family)
LYSGKHNRPDSQEKDMTSIVAPDVNTQFATERNAQAARFAKLIEEGKAKDLGDGRVLMLTGWDRGEIFQNGKPVHGLDMKANGETALYTRVPAWHALGTVVPEGLRTGAEVLRAAGLDFEIKQMPCVVNIGGTERRVPDTFVNYRSDTLAPLGTVGKIYEPFQNITAYSFLDELLNYGMVAESAGSFRGGSRVFISAKVTEDLVIDPSGVGDIIGQYLSIINSHDGSSSFVAVVSPWRPVCQNTERLALKNATTKWSIRHTKNGLNKVEEAKRSLKLTTQYFQEFKAESEALLSVPVRDNMIDGLITDIFGAPEEDAPKRAVTIDANRREDIRRVFSREVDRTGSNAYAFERAVTEYADHMAERRPRGELKNNPLAALGVALLEGSNDEVKATTHKRLMTLTNR